MDLSALFPQFEPGLVTIIEKEAVQKQFPAGEIILRTGQYIKSTVLVLEGRIKIYRENQDGGEFLMYYLRPGEACAVSMICALQSQTSEIMAMAEQEAIRRGCHGAWLDTFEFQARGFYERIGYECFGELPNYPAGFSRFFMKKCSLLLLNDEAMDHVCVVDALK